MLVPVVLVLLAVLAWQVPAGRQAASSLISDLASTRDMKVQLEGVHLAPDLDLTVDRVLLADREGVFLAAETVRLDWQPSALLQGRVLVHAADVSRLDVLRKPVAPLPGEADSADETAQDDSTLTLPAGRIEGFTIGSLILGEALLGDTLAPAEGTQSGAIEVSVTGSAAVETAPITLSGSLEILRKGVVPQADAAGPAGTGRISADMRFAPETDTLAFDLSVTEPREGLAARLLKVPGLPAIDLRLTGDGPLDDWASELSVALDGRETVKGTTRLTASGAEERTLTTNLTGDLSPLMPEMVAAFFLGDTALSGKARLTQDFRPLDGTLSLTTGTLALSADGGYAPATGAVEGKAALKLSAGNGNLIAVDLGDRQVRFGPLDLRGTLSGTLTSADWSLALDGQSLGTTEGTLSALSLKASGQGADLSPEVLTSPLSLSATLTGLAPSDPRLAPFAGDGSIALDGQADGTAQQVALTSARVTLPGTLVEIADSLVGASSLRLALTAALDDLARIAPLTGQTLEGAGELALTARGVPADLALDGSVQLALTGLRTSQAQADALLSGPVKLSTDYRLAGIETVSLSQLALTSEGLTLAGSAGREDTEIRADLTGKVMDLARLNPQVVGPLSFTLAASGPLTAPLLDLAVESDTLTLAGADLTGLKADISATASASEPAATIDVSASLKGQPLELSGRLVSADGGARLEDLEGTVAGNSLQGQFTLADLTRAPEGLEGTLSIDAPDLSTLSPLALRPLAGSLMAEIEARPGTGGPATMTIALKGSDLRVETLAIGALDLDASVSDPFSTPKIDATGRARQLLAGSTAVPLVTLSAQGSGRTTQFKTEIALEEGANPDGTTLSGTLTMEDGGAYALALDSLKGRYQGIETGLVRPSALRYADGTARIDPLTLSLGKGTLTVSGAVRETLDLSADLKDVPLTLGNAFAPDLGLGGILTGSAKVSGPASDPEVTWTAGIADLSVAQLRQKGLSVLGVGTKGTFKGGAVTQSTRLFGPDSLVLSLEGRVQTTGARSLDLAVDGSLPLSYLRRPLTEAGFRAKGALALSGKVGGTIQSPLYQLTATPRDILLTDLNTATTLQNVKGSFAVTPSGVTVSSVTGELATGGTVSVNGTVGLEPGNVASLSLKAVKARYVDPGVVNALLDADIAVEGPLTSTSSAANITGKVTIDRADISIPDSLPGTVSPVAVQHVNAPERVREQVADIGGGGKGTKEETTASLPPRLDVQVSAPGQIFVRGRGLDAELYGDLRIVGTTSAPQAIGAFTLRRGQMDVLTRRLTFSKGEATFTGDLTPVINFLATTTVSSTSINVGVSGPASDPVVSLTSSPDQPQDEILALLLFGQDMGSLSPTQIAQLAAAIATLTGGSDNGPLATLRKSLGLDAIDIDTSGENGPTVGIGKYVNDNIYLGVEQGTTEGSSRVKVDIDLDKGFKLRGEVGATGAGKAGVYFEREY